MGLVTQKVRPLMGLLQWELLGYGLYRAWILEHMAFARSFQAQSAVSSGALANLPLWTLYLAISASAATFFFLQKACRTRLLEELVPDCMAACGLIGSSCVAFAAVSGNNEVLLAGFALAGLSGGFFEVKWSLYFLRLAKDAVYCNFLLAILLTSVCGIFTSAILPPEAFFATALSLFVGMAFLERMAKERNRKLGHDDGWTHIGALSPEADSSMGKKGRNARKVFRRIVFASALYCVVHVSAITLCAASAPNDHFIRHLANFAAVGILLALFLAKGTLASIELSKFVLPLTAAGLFLLLIDARYLGDAAHFLFCFSNKLFEILIWVLVIDFIGVLSVSAAAAFGGIVAARNIGSFIGSLLSLSVLSMVGPDASNWTGFVSALTMLSIVTLLWMLSEKTFFDPLYRVNASQIVQTNESTADSSIKALLNLARERKLTSREIDVLLLLVRGKNRATIAEELCISQNTAHTHIMHVYQKLDVHDQQELIKMI